MDLPPDFRDLLEEFGRAGVEFVVVGGWAVAFHGRPRATKDIDIVLRGTPDNLARAAEALRRFGAPANDGLVLRVIGLDDLVQNKRAVGRPRDMDDVDFLERVRARRGNR